MATEPVRGVGELGTDPYEVIHLGVQAAVVVPMADFLRLKALERGATVEALQDAEDVAAVEQWQRREAAGEATYVSIGEVRRRLGLAE
jgi:hypothetical protein